MSSDIHPGIAAYFAANNTGDGQAVAATFVADGEVSDDRNRTHKGRAAIAEWVAETIGVHQMKFEALTHERDGDGHLVTARVSGNFPGSPLDYSYRFRVDSEGIRTLDIRL